MGAVLCVGYLVCKADAGSEVFTEVSGLGERHRMIPLRRGKGWEPQNSRGVIKLSSVLGEPIARFPFSS